MNNIKKKRAWKTVLMNQVEVYFGNIIVGEGLIYFDGINIIGPDVVSLTGEILPPTWYTIKSVNEEPRLAIFAGTVQ